MLPLTAVALLALPAAAPEVTSRGLAELTQHGEVLLLPKHHRTAFDGWLYTHSTETCDAIEAGMLDVENYPKRFANVAEARATRTGPADNPVVTYEMDLTVRFSPTVYGAVRRPAPRTIRYNDGKTQAYSVYTFRDADDGGCAVSYRIVEDPKESSGWVAVMEGLEATAGDSGNYAAAISSARGFARPETRKGISRGRAAEDTFAALAGKGTVVVIDRHKALPVYTLRRRVDAPVSDVIWAIRNKKGYPERTTVMKKVSDHGKSAAYVIGAFGGRVSVDTDVKDSKDDAGVVVVDEVVAGGDLAKGAGGWRWQITPVDGGADVELVVDIDFVKGSRILSAMADADAIARESFMLHIALSLMGDLVPGKPLPLKQTTIAREMPLAAEPSK